MSAARLRWLFTRALRGDSTAEWELMRAAGMGLAVAWVLMLMARIVSAPWRG